MPLHWDASEFRNFARALRRQQPELSKRTRHDLRVHSHLITDELKAKLPHQANASAAKRGVRYSDSLASNGAAVIIGGPEPPQRWAFAFLYGNKGKGYYVHKVYGRLAYSPKVVMRTSPALDEVIAKAGPEILMRVETTVEEILAEVAWGSRG